jgi:hypothetical protein
MHCPGQRHCETGVYVCLSADFRSIAQPKQRLGRTRQPVERRERKCVDVGLRLLAMQHFTNHPELSVCIKNMPGLFGDDSSMTIKHRLELLSMVEGYFYVVVSL